jgi:aspartyl-tRNA(Asn)/glutamyl-tRNA(Gln) amidotransferase subunit C
MAVTRDDLMHVADLARVHLEEARVPALVAQLNGILAHMGVLAKVRTDGVQATAGVGDAGLPLRADVGPPIPLDRPPEAFAPRQAGGGRAWRDGFFAVPRLATHEGADEAPEP